MRRGGSFLPVALGAALAACAQPGAGYAPDIYAASQLNQRQDARTVDILAVTPARVAVSNAANQRTAQVAGGLLGALAGGVIGNNVGSPSALNTVFGGAAGGVTGLAAGSLVPGQVLVDGVSLTFRDDGRMFSATQIGRMCEFAPGRALLVSSGGNETRIQPNASCAPPANT